MALPVIGVLEHVQARMRLTAVALSVRALC